MTSPTTKAQLSPTQAATPASGAAPALPISKTADYVYRIAAMTAGIALLMTVV